jgi:hypothetical protein
MMLIYGENNQCVFNYFFAIDRVKAMAIDHPECKTQQPYKAV